ncbi:hypothetical protein TW91_0196 [Neisseria flavescens]|nr:hypothetical protein TW91_0196 [Neisseria flavescens]KZC85494.1 hypothetical protein TW89_1397 [Neisseria flavescens]
MKDSHRPSENDKIAVNSINLASENRMMPFSDAKPISYLTIST